MPEIKLTLRPGYQQSWPAIRFNLNEKNMSEYIRNAVGGYYFTDGASCDAQGGTAKRVNVRNMETGADMYRHSWATVCFPAGVIRLPDVILVHPSTGTLKLTEYKSLGFWDSFKSTLSTMKGGPLFRIFVSIVFPAFLTDSALGLKILAAINWVTTFIDKITSPWLDKVNKYLDDFDKFTVKYYLEVKHPFVALKNSVYRFIEPTLLTLKRTFEAYRTVTTDILDTQQRILDTIHKPVLIFEQRILQPLRLTGLRIDQQLSSISDFLVVFGINEGEKVRKEVGKVFDNVYFVMDAKFKTVRTQTRKLETKFNNFYNTVFGPLKTEHNRYKDIIDAVIDISDVVTEANAKLRKQPLQNTLTAYPELVAESSESNLSSEEIDFVYEPIKIPETLPEVEWWSKAIDDADEYLYLDDKNTPLQKALTPTGELSDNPGDFRGKVENISAIIQKPRETNTHEVTAFNSLWSRAIENAEVLDLAQPKDEPKKLNLDLAKDLGLVLFPFGWLYYLNYEYTLTSLETIVNYPDAVAAYNEALAKSFWDDVKWLASWVPERQIFEYPPRLF